MIADDDDVNDVDAVTVTVTMCYVVFAVQRCARYLFYFLWPFTCAPLHTFIADI